MSNDRYERVKSVFLAAHEREPDGRESFLDEACREEASVRADVRSLLLNLERAERVRFLARPAVAPRPENRGPDSESSQPRRPEASFSVPSWPEPGSLVGAYRLIRPIGTGGMGIVYEAEQANPRRRVALKLIRGSVSLDEERVRRFRREIMSLARLKHPSIASIYDAGSTAEGAPYFAMELVEGMPLLEAVNGRGLSYRQRLELFLEICEAVTYAHQRGVIHQDLKPANILACDDGAGAVHGPRIKILDFGLSRVVEGDDSGTTASARVGIWGTLEYMSPEQAGAGPSDADVRTDVYSLGVTLFEILTGQYPIVVDRANVPRTIRAICEAEPRRPRSLVPALPADVEAIVLKALEKSPGRRYPSVEALADDVRRFLYGRPVLARRNTIPYVVGRFVRRHKLGVASGVALAAILAIGGGLALRSARAALRADAYGSFLKTVLSAIDPVKAKGKDTSLLRSVVDAAARDARQRFSDLPEAEAEIQATVGRLYMQIGEYAAADQPLRAALELRERLCGPDSTDTLASVNDRAVWLQANGRLIEAEPLFRRAVDGCIAILGRESMQTLEAMNNLGMLLHLLGRSSEAAGLLSEVRATRERLYGRNNRNTLLSEANLAKVYEELGRSDDAEKLSRSALEGRRALLGDDDPETIDSYQALGELLDKRNRVPDAEDLLRKGLGLSQRVLGPEHETTITFLNDLASLLLKKGDLEAAGPLFREATHLAENRLGEANPKTVRILTNYGVLLLRSGKLEEAEAVCRRNIEVCRRQLGAEHDNSVIAMHTHAACLIALKKHEEAAEECQSILETLGRRDHPRVELQAKCLLNLGICLTELRAWTRAEEALLQSRDLLATLYQPGDPTLERADRQLALLRERRSEKQ